MNTVLLFLITIVIIVAILLKEGRGFTGVIKFAYPNAKYNAIGNPYVLKEKLDSILELKSLQEFVNVLEKEYNLKEIKDIEELEDALIKYRSHCFHDILNDSPPQIKKFYQTYFEKYELEIIKSILRSKLENEEIEKLHPFGKINEEIIYKMKEANALEIIDLLKDYKYFKDFEMCENLKGLVESYDGNFLEIDSLLDKYYFKNLKIVEKEIMKNFRKPFKKIINLQIDITNIKILLRAKENNLKIETLEKLVVGEGRELPIWKLKQLFLAENISEIIDELSITPYKEPLKSVKQEYEKSKDIFVLEKALDSYLLKICREISLKHFLTSGPILRFLISKEFEIRNLRTIARGIHEKIGGKNILKLLILEGNL